MTTVGECQMAARELLEETVARVRYLGLFYQGSDAAWDFGEWHWPEVGVEFETASGRYFYAIWDSRVTQFELALNGTQAATLSSRQISSTSADGAPRSWASQRTRITQPSFASSPADPFAAQLLSNCRPAVTDQPLT